MKKQFKLTSKTLNLLASLLIPVFILLINMLIFSNINLLNNESNIFHVDDNISCDASNKPLGKLAIIIDDFGQNRNGVKEMMAINKHLTFAIMPFLAYSQIDAVNAHNKGFEVISHIPMESNGGKRSWLGPKPILSSMDDNKIKEVTSECLDNIPYAVGANIHMGAKAGDDKRVISQVLEVIKSRNLYFVDSRASKNPVAKSIASIKQVRCYDRNIFLDGKKSKKYIVNQLKKAADIALKKGFAVAIGHVGNEGGKITAEAILEVLPEFEAKNIRLVFVSELKFY